jgi:hypothetical protein
MRSPEHQATLGRTFGQRCQTSLGERLLDPESLTYRRGPQTCRQPLTAFPRLLGSNSNRVPSLTLMFRNEKHGRCSPPSKDSRCFESRGHRESQDGVLGHPGEVLRFRPSVDTLCGSSRRNGWYTPRREWQSVKKTFVLSLGLGIALGVAGTLLVQHGFRPRTPGLIRMTTISSERAHVDGVVQEQQLQRKVYSVYPAAAEAGNSSGTVLFRVLIAQDGSVDSVEYLSGPAVFVEGAKSAVQQYRYKPTVVGNMPVEVETIVAVPFVLPQ